MSVMQTTVVSVGELKQRRAAKGKGTHHWTNNKRLHEVLVAKHKGDLDLDYLNARTAFGERLAAEQTSRLIKLNTSDDRAIAVTFQPGRKFDKVIVVTIDMTSGDRLETQVRYFVDNKTGDIYGPKSSEAPNTKAWYGTLSDVDKWDWSGEWAMPKDFNADLGMSEKAGVKLTGEYGPYKHFAKLTAKDKQKLVKA